LANNDISTKIEFKNKDEDFDLVLHISSLNDFNISTTSSECLNYVKYINNTSDFPYISDIDIVKCIPEGETIYIDLINLNITDLYDTLMNFYSVGNYTKRSIKIANNYYYDIYFKKKIIQKLIQNWKSYLGLFLEYDNEIKWEFNSLSTIPSLSNMTTLAIRPYSPILEIITEIKIYTLFNTVGTIGEKLLLKEKEKKENESDKLIELSIETKLKLTEQRLFWIDNFLESHIIDFELLKQYTKEK
ncbi:6076_t:CDS:2, partial [Entrophospora sp. SA101]